jgi:hypothetical protein
MPLRAQSAQPLQPDSGTIVGTVTDVNGDAVALAQVFLEGPTSNDRRTAVTNEYGFFEFHDVQPGASYHIAVIGAGFAYWRSTSVTIVPSQYKIVTGIHLIVATVRITTKVTPGTDQTATELVKQEERQRIFGVFPNFYAVYTPGFVPLTAKLKFRLALRTAIDPASFLAIAFISSTQQAGDTPAYGQGAAGFARRFGADTASVLTSIMIGNALLPSLLHQDPRYFYQGTGTKKSRIEHAISSPFVCKGDNGRWQPNYSSLSGAFASSVTANVYYPEQNRGIGSTFTRFAINTGARMAVGLAQEFIPRKASRKRGHLE